MPGARAVRPGPAAALMTDDLRRLLELLDRTPLGLRDRALLLLGFAGAFRRSELVSLDVGDLEFTPRGVRVQLRRSKTDQEAGRLSDRGVARVVQRWAERAGLDPSRFAGHSLRAGLATSAAAGRSPVSDQSADAGS